MKILVLGSSGKLGKEFLNKLKFNKKKFEIITSSRSSGAKPFDLTNTDLIRSILNEINPNIIVNCSGNVDLLFCEQNKEYIEKLHIDAIENIANWSKNNSSRYIHISTDHFFDGDGDKLHNENERTKLLNFYAFSKYEGEKNLLDLNNSVVIRTSFISFGPKESNSFGNWLIKTIFTEKTPSLFSDSFTSSLDVETLGKALVEVTMSNFSGLLNIGCKESYSKSDLVLSLLNKFKIQKEVEFTSVKNLLPERADSLGLDCSLFEKNFQTKLPNFNELVDYIYDQIQSRI